MKIPKYINQRLAKVDIPNRVFIYDVSTIREFLNVTFMPTRYYLKPEIIPKVGAGYEINKYDLNDPSKESDYSIDMNQLYDYYKLYRDSKEYTTPVETKYKFSLIIKKMLLPKNNWQFSVKRFGREQKVKVFPCCLRSKVPPEIKTKFPILT